MGSYCWHTWRPWLFMIGTKGFECRGTSIASVTTASWWTTHPKRVQGSVETRQQKTWQLVFPKVRALRKILVNCCHLLSTLQIFSISVLQKMTDTQHLCHCSPLWHLGWHIINLLQNCFHHWAWMQPWGPSRNSLGTRWTRLWIAMQYLKSLDYHTVYLRCCQGPEETERPVPSQRWRRLPREVLSVCFINRVRIFQAERQKKRAPET